MNTTIFFVLFGRMFYRFYDGERGSKFSVASMLENRIHYLNAVADFVIDEPGIPAEQGW